MNEGIEDDLHELHLGTRKGGRELGQDDGGGKVESNESPSVKKNKKHHHHKHHDNVAHASEEIQKNAARVTEQIYEAPKVSSASDEFHNRKGKLRYYQHVLCFNDVQLRITHPTFVCCF